MVVVVVVVVVVSNSRSKSGGYSYDLFAIPNDLFSLRFDLSVITLYLLVIT